MANVCVRNYLAETALAQLRDRGKNYESSECVLRGVPWTQDDCASWINVTNFKTLVIFFALLFLGDNLTFYESQPLPWLTTLFMATTTTVVATPLHHVIVRQVIFNHYYSNKTIEHERNDVCVGTTLNTQRMTSRYAECNAALCQRECTLLWLTQHLLKAFVKDFSKFFLVY